MDAISKVTEGEVTDSGKTAARTRWRRRGGRKSVREVGTGAVEDGAIAHFRYWEAGFCVAVGICLGGFNYLGLPRAVEFAGLATALVGVLFGGMLMSLAAAATVCGVQFEGVEGFAGIPGLNAMNLACGLYLVRILVFPPRQMASNASGRPSLFHLDKQWSTVVWSYGILVVLRLIGELRSGEIPLSFALGFGRNAILFYGAYRAAARSNRLGLLGAAAVPMVPAILLSAWTGRMGVNLEAGYGLMRRSLTFDANGLCFWADMLVIITLAYWSATRKLWAKPLLVLSLMVLFFTIAVSFSRSGQICIAIGMASWMLLARQGRLTSLLLVAGLLAVLLVGKWSYFAGRWQYSIDNPDEMVGAEDEGSRVDNWLKTWEAAKQNLIFGMGGRNYMTFLEERHGYAYRAHNEYLEILADSGLIGLTVYLVMVVKLFGGVWAVRRRARSKEMALLSNVLLTWLWMYVVFCIAGAIAMAGPRSLSFYILVGALSGSMPEGGLPPRHLTNARKRRNRIQDHNPSAVAPESPKYLGGTSGN